jgi:hypothetical protein
MAVISAPNGISVPLMYALWLLGLFGPFPLYLGYGWFKHRQSPGSVLRFLQEEVVMKSELEDGMLALLCDRTPIKALGRGNMRSAHRG